MPQIKEFHFHVYWEVENSDKAMYLHDLIKSNDSSGIFTAKILRINSRPVGPHPVPSFETWVPFESFAHVYEFFLRQLPVSDGISVLIHPLTRHEILDHTTRATFLGKSYPLDLSVLHEELPEVPAQYPELGLGYSKPAYHGTS